MADRVIHVSEAEAVNDFAGLLARVRAGAEIVVESGKLPVAVIHAPAVPRRTLSECIALAKAREAETGEAPVLDADFASDMEDILKQRPTWDPPAWE
jgi:antitoxin (DNA-binding transcriptional repressor) of toxin-antitoxin stability system